MSELYNKLHPNNVISDNEFTSNPTHKSGSSYYELFKYAPKVELRRHTQSSQVWHLRQTKSSDEQHHTNKFAECTTSVSKDDYMVFWPQWSQAEPLKKRWKTKLLKWIYEGYSSLEILSRVRFYLNNLQTSKRASKQAPCLHESFFKLVEITHKLVFDIYLLYKFSELKTRKGHIFYKHPNMHIPK